MVKATALYMVIIIALVIGLLCSSLIVASYFYRSEYQKKFRYDQLQNNVGSGINILLAGDDTSFSAAKTFSLFNGDADSVILKRHFWGIYDVGVSRAFIQKDTLFKTFSIGYTIDSAKWAALYLIDEDRPMSLSGKTTIRGDAYIPKAGVSTAYIDNKAYQGDKRLIIGLKKNSDRVLPALFKQRLDAFKPYLTSSNSGDTSLIRTDSIRQSFLVPTHVFNFKKKVQTISGIKLTGNIILMSDTTIIIDSTARLNNIMVFAKAIAVKSGFHGNCQLFARDSIGIDSNCRFEYPSCLGILRFTEPGIAITQEKIVLGNNSTFVGILFTYEAIETTKKPMIDLGKNVNVTGQVYSQGIVKTKDSVKIAGSVFTSKFLYQNTFTLFENYLINITIDSKQLSPYYLTSGLLPVAGKKKKILQWLETN